MWELLNIVRISPSRVHACIHIQSKVEQAGASHTKKATEEKECIHPVEFIVNGGYNHLKPGMLHGRGKEGYPHMVKSQKVENLARLNTSIYS